MAHPSGNAGWYNIAIGYRALEDISTGYENLGIGNAALANITSGYNNVAIGSGTLNFDTTGNRNIAIGYRALYNSRGSGLNVAIGASALNGNWSGNYNTAIGWNSMFGVTNQNPFRTTAIGSESFQDITSGNDNVGIGYRVGYLLTTGDDNVLIGAYAGDNLTTGSGNIIIGKSLDASAVGATNEINVGGVYKGTVNAEAVIGKGTKHDGCVINKAAEVQTTDATLTTVETITLLDENTYQIEALVIGVQSDGANRASYKLIGTFYRTGAGNATQQGTTTRVHEMESAAAWDVNLVVSGNTVLVRVTGVAATTIEWGCTSKYINMSN